MNFKQALAHFIPQIDAEIKDVLSAKDETDVLHGMLNYHMGWLNENLEPEDGTTGKRLRPVFTLLSCQALGGEPKQALPAAAAVELIHNFSLIHDDIEDGSDMRHGRRTVWHIWGEPQAINAGDAMFVLARNVLLQLRRYDIPLPTIFEAVNKLDQTCLQLCQGQYLDMSFEQTLDVSLDAYLDMIAGKTSALLACSGYLGALIATNDSKRAQQFYDLGLALGLAFQIQDDWLGIWGDEKLTGKPTADDLRRRKKSMPVVFALNHDNASLSDQFKKLYTKSDVHDTDIADAITILDELGAKAYTESMAKKYIDQAEALLVDIDMAGDSVALQEMAHFLINRLH
ncbi:MAG: polyprenyl synthetase family protein [Chloroflexota bacterium]